MKIIATSDWHLGNLFHGNDRLPEHRHFLAWLTATIEEQQPDALLVAGDVFDNGNPSAAAQSAYYEFLADAAEACPAMRIVITAGNHDSAHRLEAPRPLLTRHHVEVRGNVQRQWMVEGDKGQWVNNYSDLMIPVSGRDGLEIVVLAVPYLRNDVVQNACYSQGVNRFLRALTQEARATYPGRPLVMMAHMYAKGAEIAGKDPSEKVVIGGQEEVIMEGWADHPDYLTCGHIHKRQLIWNTDWARYTGSVLPMSFAEKDYQHGVDLVTIEAGHELQVTLLPYCPQHPLLVLPEGDEELTPKQMKKLVEKVLPPRLDAQPDEHAAYVVLKVKMDKASSEEIKALEDAVASKNAVLCKLQKIMPALDLTTLSGTQHITSIDDILDRDPMETLSDTFNAIMKKKMNENQEQMLRDMLDGMKIEE